MRALLELDADPSKIRFRRMSTLSFVLSAVFLIAGAYVYLQPGHDDPVILILLFGLSVEEALSGVVFSQWGVRGRYPVVVRDDGILFHATLVDRMAGREAFVPRERIDKAVVGSSYGRRETRSHVTDDGDFRPRMALVYDVDGVVHSTGTRHPDDVKAMVSILMDWGVTVEG